MRIHSRRSNILLVISSVIVWPSAFVSCFIVESKPAASWLSGLLIAGLIGCVATLASMWHDRHQA